MNKEKQKAFAETIHKQISTCGGYMRTARSGFKGYSLKHAFKTFSEYCNSAKEYLQKAQYTVNTEKKNFGKRKLPTLVQDLDEQVEDVNSHRIKAEEFLENLQIQKALDEFKLMGEEAEKLAAYIYDTYL